METRKQAILDALDAHVNQRSGIDFRNYGDVKSFRAEQRSITRDLHDYRAIRNAVAWRDSITADMILEASQSAFSGRLTIHHCPHGDSAKATCGSNAKHVWCAKCDPAPSAHCHWCHGRGYSTATMGVTRIEYCTGQYFPTEYRKAACAVLASALWYWTREHAMPAPNSWRVEEWGRLGHARERSKPLQIHAACELLEQKGGSSYGFVQDYVDGKTPGDWLRSHFRKEFGRRIAGRYFD